MRDKSRRPMLIRGARQVGKTWLVREHARLYPSFVEINLESHPEYIPLFREQFGKPKDLLIGIAAISGQKLVPGETLLFIDEIQESKEALLSLRYFYENLPGQPVIAAGSLLEFCFQDLSFPVGRIEFFHLFPLNFEEYLIAMGRDDLISMIEQVNPKKPLAQAIHNQLMDEVAIYSLIGGLPEVVHTFVTSKDWRKCQEILQILVGTYREDFHKYSSRAEVEILRLLFSEIPRLLGQKFKYSHVDPSVKAGVLSRGLDHLEKAGLIYRSYHSSANGLPLGAQINRKKFKVFFLDVGLAQRILGLTLSEIFLKRRELLAQRGAIAEQFVAQELLSQTQKNETPQIFFWQRESRSSQAEVDFLIERESSPLPIEVKSGHGKGLKSMHLFLEEKKAYIHKGIKVSQANISMRDTITTLPLYALLKLRP